MRILDAHTHIGLKQFCTSQESSFPYDLCNTYEDTISLMDQCQVERSVIVPIPHYQFDTKLSNAYVFEAYCKFPNRFVPFCRVDESLEKNLAQGFQGVKLHLLYEKIEVKDIKRELQIIEDAGVPLLLHAQFQDKVKQVEKILRIAPNLTVILAHMGRGHLYTGEQVVANAIGLRNYQNVFMDTSTVGEAKSIINACEILGYDRIVYGSDYPFGKNVFKEKYDYTLDINQLIDALSPQQADMIMGENLLRLLRRQSSEAVHIRRAKRSDCEQIMTMIDHIDENDKKYLAFSSKQSVIRKTIRSERHCYVALFQEKIVGFLRESGRPEGYSLLEEIVVLPLYRNRGVASALLEYYHNAFKKNMAKTNAKNFIIIHLLHKNGYIAENPDAPRIINWTRDRSNCSGDQ